MFRYSDVIDFDLRKNSFNFIRLFLAFLVLVAHSWELGGFGNDAVYQFSGNIYSIGALAVDCFFCISGMLITASYININSLGVFIWHRLLRIFPGYWLCIILTAVLLPVIFGSNPNIDYALHNLLNPAKSIFEAMIGLFTPIIIGWVPNLSNLASKIPMFGQNIIPGIISDQPVNGSLWTLVHEIRLYCLIAILGSTGLLKKPVLIILLLISWIAYSYFVLKNPSHAGLSFSGGFRTTSHFVAGALFYLYMPQLKHYIAITALIMSVIALGLGFYPLVSPITTTYLIVYAAATIPLHNFGAKHDFSYGLYIYAFPVQKMLTALSLNHFGLIVYILLTFLISFVLAVISWFSIEKYALKLKYWKFNTLRARGIKEQ